MCLFFKDKIAFEAFTLPFNLPFPRPRLSIRKSRIGSFPIATTVVLG